MTFLTTVVHQVPFGSVVTAAAEPVCHCQMDPPVVGPDVALVPRAPLARAHQWNRRSV
jgi:hypothetical protein